MGVMVSKEIEHLKEISNTITVMRILISKEQYDKADEVAEKLQFDILDYIAND